MKKIVAIGGAGNMVQVAVKVLLDIYESGVIVLADNNLEKASGVAASYGTSRVTPVFVDLYRPELLRDVIRGCDLVINGAGPYYRTGVPVLEACIDEKVHYIDLGDDDESATALLAMDGKARAAGITALICCGIAPGLLNVVAAWLARKLDSADTVEVAWVTGSGSDPDRKREGAAVIEHMVHISMGQCVTVSGGERKHIPSFSRGRTIDFPEPLGRYTVYEIGHAETATIPHFMPAVKNVRTMGALYPSFLNGLFRGVAWLVERRLLSMKEAVAIIMDLDQGKSAGGFRINALMVVSFLRQLLSGGITAGEFLALLRAEGTAGDAHAAGGIMVAVEGTRGGKRLRLAIKNSMLQGAPRDAGALEMDEATGTPLAVFASILIDGHITKKGVLAPEGCIDPDMLFERLERLHPKHFAMIDDIDERRLS